MDRWNTVGRRWRMVVVAALLLAAITGRFELEALAQNPVKSDAWHAVVDTDRLNIHSGRAEQFEKIGTLKRGDVVIVKSVNTFGWAAIAPPPGLHGFVARQDVADGDTAGTVRAIGRVSVLYPISEDPAQCFRKSRVEPDTVLTVLGEVPTADNAMFLKVEMPEQVDVYVLAQFLRRATDEEIAAWKARLQEEAEETAPPVVTPAPPQQQQNEPTNEPVADPEPEPASPEVIPPAESPVVEPETPVEQPETAPTEIEAGETGIAPEGEPAAPVEETEEPVEVTLANLEQLYSEMVKVPILAAEAEPLLDAFRGFAAATEKESERRVAELRIALLEIRLDHQIAMRKLKNAAEAANQPIQPQPVEIWRDESGRPVFTAQGRLASSNVFDGRRLPLLYRVQDEITGRTIAYLSVEPADRLEVERRLNLNVGVVGDTVHDPGLRIDVVKVKRIVDLDEGE